jgi:beta-carotene 3-hydroxylase
VLFLLKSLPMNWIWNVVAVLAAFLATEGFAWWLHKYIMHGALWSLHESHHVKDKHHFFERNDWFLLFFAVPGAYLIASGIIYSDVRLFLGIGITLYGLVYFLVHDVFIHQRYSFFKYSNNRYFRALRRAHHAHHKHTGRDDGESFGLLWVSKKYFEK